MKNTKVTIAICDDDEVDRQRIRKHIQKYLLTNIETDIFEYSSGEALLNAITTDKLELSLIFLDIQMKNLDGNETARRIRNLDDRVVLVFYTGYLEPSPQCFEVQPYRYIMKSMPESEMLRYIEASMRKMYSINAMPTIEAKVNGTKILFKLEEIVYIEKYKKNTRVHISEKAGRLRGINTENSDQAIRISDKLDNLYCKLIDFGFGHPHDSYIINFKYLTACKNDEFQLVGITHTVFKITRSKALEFNLLKNRYMTSKYDEC